MEELKDGTWGPSGGRANSPLAWAAARAEPTRAGDPFYPGDHLGPLRPYRLG